MVVKKIEMFGLPFSALSLEQAITEILAAGSHMEKCRAIPINIDCIIKLTTDVEFLDICKTAEFIFADGMPLVWLSMFNGKNMKLQSRVTGADLLRPLTLRALEKNLTVAFIGGNAGVVDLAASKLRQECPIGGKIVTYFPPFGFEMNEEESSKIVEFINREVPHLLFFGVGAPKQEKWTWQYYRELNCGVIICCGAAFDFVAETVKRAPNIFQKLGLEWFWRMIHEPRRLGPRYLTDILHFTPLAITHILKDSKRGMR